VNTDLVTVFTECLHASPCPTEVTDCFLVAKANMTEHTINQIADAIEAAICIRY